MDDVNEMRGLTEYTLTFRFGFLKGLPDETTAAFLDAFSSSSDRMPSRRGDDASADAFSRLDADSFSRALRDRDAESLPDREPDSDSAQPDFHRDPFADADLRGPAWRSFAACQLPLRSGSPVFV